MAGGPTTYWEYLGLETLLGLQGGLEGDDAKLENEEVMFIVIHQIDELWFKLAIRELASARDLFARDHVPEQHMAQVVRGLRRCTQIFHQLSGHFALMESMTTRDYLAFRDKLSPASGFQSAQLREVEILMGLDMGARIPLGNESYLQALKAPDGSESPASRRVAARLNDHPTLLEAIDEWLWRTPIDGSTPVDAGDADAVQGFLARYLAANDAEVDGIANAAKRDALTPEDEARLEKRYSGAKASARAFLMAEDIDDEALRARRRRIRAAVLFIESYRELPLLTWPRELVDALVELEQAFVIFRQRHARMVERVIGRRTGTGGSAGVDYLDRTALEYRIFKDLWAVRTLLLRRSALPALEHTEFYEFARSVE